MGKELHEMHSNVKHMDSMLRSVATWKRDAQKYAVPTYMHAPAPTLIPIPSTLGTDTSFTFQTHIPLEHIDKENKNTPEYAAGKGIHAAKLLKKHIPPKVYYR